MIDFKKVYDSARWRRTRAAVLKRSPLCLHCRMSGRAIPATQIDHIISLADGGAIWDRSNLQALCLPCHARKTARRVRERKFAILDERGYLVGIQ